MTRGTTTLNRATGSTAAAPDTTVQHAGRQLLDAVERVLRKADSLHGSVLLALHLSNLVTGARAYHRRVAASVLDDLASRNNGQLFALANGDMAMLFRPADGGAGAAAVIARLFQNDAAPDRVRSMWTLPAAAMEALEYIRLRVLEGDRAQPAAEPQASASAIAAMDGMVQSSPLGDLVHRQTAVLLRPGHTRRVTPLFREVAISMAVLEARVAAIGQANADPFLFSHLAARLDRRMLAALPRDLVAEGPLSGRLGAAALHVNLTLTGILSEGFAAFAEASQEPLRQGLRIGIEVPFVEVFADPNAFVLARERVRLAGLQLVLDGLSHEALLLTSPAALRPDLVKLNWSPALLETGAAGRAAIDRLGRDNVVLHRCDAEAAVTWGLERGIQRFQGHYVDLLLAAERLAGCPGARGCTVRQCKERASATAAGGRAGCTNTALLDTALRLAEPALA